MLESIIMMSFLIIFIGFVLWLYLDNYYRSKNVDNFLSGKKGMKMTKNNIQKILKTYESYSIKRI